MSSSATASARGHHALIREHTTIGDYVLVGTGTIIDGQVTIGSYVSIQSRVYIPTHTIIGDYVFIGPCVVLTNDKYPLRQRATYEPLGPQIADHVSIGANATTPAGRPHWRGRGGGGGRCRHRGCTGVASCHRRARALPAPARSSARAQRGHLRPARVGAALQSCHDCESVFKRPSCVRAMLCRADRSTTLLEQFVLTRVPKTARIRGLLSTT